MPSDMAKKDLTDVIKLRILKWEIVLYYLGGLSATSRVVGWEGGDRSVRVGE